MFTFLFWNLAGKPIQDLVADAALSVGADCIVLCECSVLPSDMVAALNRTSSEYRYAPGRILGKLVFFTKFEPSFLWPRFENPRISIRHLTLPARKDILIVAVHLPSKLFFSADSLTQECWFLADYINREEKQIGHRRTIVVGDLNLNPFDTGIVGSAGLHAVSSRTVAMRRTRTVQDRQSHFFYNPMWKHLADGGNDPSGTYYYDRAEPVNYFWNVFDQVLLRPDLLNGFDSSSLQILTSAGTNKLVDASGRPDRAKSSDHLPVVFSLSF